jgi:O-antigen/teichoic acid export membrane protein
MVIPFRQDMTSSAAPAPSSDPTSLKQRVLRAGTWSLAGYALGQAIRFGTNLLMTRLLVPEMFGVMAIANMVMMSLAMFSDLGLKQNIIQSKRGNDPAFLNTAWMAQICRGIVLWIFALSLGLLIFVADRVGIVPKNSAYADPRLPYVIVVLSFTALIGGFQSTKLFEASRNLALGYIAKFEIVTQAAGLLFMLGWVSINRSIWALVAGNICAALVGAMVSHTWLPGVGNRWEWDKSAFREIIHFGKWMFVSSILGFLVNSGDRLLLGGLINSTLLGIYVIAFAIFNSVEQLLTKIINDISLSALSEVARDRPGKLKANYYRFHIVIGSFACFCSGILMFAGQSLVGLLYDRRYEQAGWMLEVLATALLITPFNLAIMCLLALGLPNLFAQIIAIRMVSLFLLLPLGYHYFGLLGALWGFVASYSSILPATIYYKIRYSLFDPLKELLLIPAWLGGILFAKALNLVIGYYLN